jgi:hypothetical protein
VLVWAAVIASSVVRFERSATNVSVEVSADVEVGDICLAARAGASSGFVCWPNKFPGLEMFIPSMPCFGQYTIQPRCIMKP